MVVIKPKSVLKLCRFPVQYLNFQFNERIEEVQ